MAHGIIDVVLADDAYNADALALRGDILVHEGRYRAGMREARKALATDKDHGDALEVLADAHVALGQWHDLAQVAEQLITVRSEDRDLARAREYRIRALRELGR